MAEEKKESNELKGFADILGIKDIKNIPEWVAPLLSALGGVGGSYIFLTKPLQEKIVILENRIHALEQAVTKLSEYNVQQEQELEEVREQLETNLNGLSYLPIKKPTGQQVRLLRKRI